MSPVPKRLTSENTREKMLEKPHVLPNPEEYLPYEQRWEAIAELLASMVTHHLESTKGVAREDELGTREIK